MHLYSQAFVLPLLLSGVFGLRPTRSTGQCRGHCVHEEHPMGDKAGASITISGPSHAVADLTTAANWEMLSCPKAWPAHGASTFRLVCTAEDPSSSCAHVTEQGAVNTIVHMPAECGVGPFARIAAWDAAGDQSVPSEFAREHGLEAGAEVIEATVDHEFQLIPKERGEISFDIRAAHDPRILKRLHTAEDVVLAIRDIPEALNGPYTPSPQPMPTGYPSGNGYAANNFGLKDIGGLFTSIGKDITSVGKDVGKDITSVGKDITSGAKEAATAVSTALSTAIEEASTAIEQLPTIIESHLPSPTDLPGITYNKDTSNGVTILNTGPRNMSIFTTSVGCTFGRTSFDAQIGVNAEFDATLNAGYALKMSGKFPWDIAEFAFAGVLSGSLKAAFDIDMFLNGDMSLDPVQVANLGIIPGLSYPPFFTAGPLIALEFHTEVAIDTQLNARIPFTWEFERLDFVFPPKLAQPQNGAASASHSTASFELSMAPGATSASIGLHMLPKLEFGLDILNGHFGADVYVGVDVDATYSANGTIHEDFSVDGCQEISVGASVLAGVQASAFEFLTVDDPVPLYTKRIPIWSHCTSSVDGPAAAIYDNGDGTYTNAMGDLVNENGQLIDDQGNVIPDEDAGDAAPPPVYDEDGQAVPEDQVIFQNDDGTYEDSQGNPVNQDGQRIAPSGEVMGCDLDTSDLVDDTGNPIAPEDAIFDNGDGTYSNGKCQIVNEDGQPIDQDGNVIDYEPITDENGNEIPPEDVVIDNGDGTYSDAYGNPVDQYGGAIDVDADGNVIPVDLQPSAPLDDSQLPADPQVTSDPEFNVLNPDLLKSLAVDLVDGVPATLPPDVTPFPTTEAPPVTTTSDSPTNETVDAQAPTTTTPASKAPAPTCKPVTQKRSTKRSPTTKPKRKSKKRSKYAKRQHRLSTTRSWSNGTSPVHSRGLGSIIPFGCYPPTLDGMFMPPIYEIGQLTRMF
ncbi:hypothetical protein EXIGLDRAFT_746750 [Exidia glandulosa HHB12029]|uniref:Uncharacterized protein n=1 Tax=Exidia glandulosa HHB12029 TaxID=1314781 RepID=A0A165LNC5_EXIGL|nr:hypothetical protein EXIGLDRAFT_746750 [Exidia glandulosa HHB12029]